MLLRKYGARGTNPKRERGESGKPSRVGEVAGRASCAGLGVSRRWGIYLHFCAVIFFSSVSVKSGVDGRGTSKRAGIGWVEGTVSKEDYAILTTTVTRL